MKRTKIRFVQAALTMVLLGAYGCASQPEPVIDTSEAKPEIKQSEPRKPREKLPVTEAQAEKAKDAVRHGLKDPDSAQFRDLYEVPSMRDDSGSRAVCGEVNARNSYGGYVGFRRFLYLPSGKALVANSRDSFNLKVIRMSCD